MATYNAKVSKINADAAAREGYYRGGVAQAEGERVESSQVAAAGASGASVDSGSFGEDTQAQMFRTNQAAGVEIWKGKTEQVKYLNEEKLYKAQAKAEKIGGFINAASSLVGGFSGMVGAGGLGTASYAGGPPTSIL